MIAEVYRQHQEACLLLLADNYLQAEEINSHPGAFDLQTILNTEAVRVRADVNCSRCNDRRRRD